MEPAIGKAPDGLDVVVPAPVPTALNAGESHVTLGDHSVTLNTVTDKLIFDMSVTKQAADILDLDNGISMRSYLSRSAWQGIAISHW